jgi:hypothetical protein
MQLGEFWVSVQPLATEPRESCDIPLQAIADFDQPERVIVWFEADVRAINTQIAIDNADRNSSAHFDQIIC